MLICTGLITTKFAFKFGRFGQTINRAFLWYGIAYYYIISTIAIFVFDCLPEVFAGFYWCRYFYLCYIPSSEEICYQKTYY